MVSRNGSSGLEEKRKYARLEKEFVMQYAVLVNSELPVAEPELQGMVIDVGGGGLRFLTSETIEKNVQLSIVLEFTGWKVEGNEWIHTKEDSDRGVLKVLARVMWGAPSPTVADKYEIGVCFFGRIQ
ncbi:MAG: PilZ domain-containing protein [Proteobacteria bacterium]|nr:PilZ domain-containing protein [Pseudomonadota bacterium]MBU1715884.1 PilZ domain-containing protein [Pseudomonadota bacterium]